MIYNGIEIRDFENQNKYNHPNPFILGIGRFVPQKGFDVLIDAFAGTNLNTHDLVLAGDRPERTNLEQRAQAGYCREGTVFGAR